mmetsp:Transcript_798/g.1697  ORF Transcript_798/g.1697 Transcript_798/m.1697 type:complete len:256 (+) Transcript_798:1408-2175(+)
METARQLRLQSTLVVPEFARPLLSRQVSTPCTIRLQVCPSSEHSSEKTHDSSFICMMSTPDATQLGRLVEKSALQEQYFCGFVMRSPMNGASGLSLSVAILLIASTQPTSLASGVPPSGAQAATMSPNISAPPRTAVTSSVASQSVHSVNSVTVVSAAMPCIMLQSGGVSSGSDKQCWKSMSMGISMPPSEPPSSSPSELARVTVISSDVVRSGSVSVEDSTLASLKVEETLSSDATSLMESTRAPSSIELFRFA